MRRGFVQTHLTCKLCVIAAVVITLPLVKNLEFRGHKGAGALGRSEKPSEIKIRPGNSTLSRLQTHDTKKKHK